MLETAAHLLFPSFLAALLLGVAGVVAGPYLARFAARRTVAQPLVMALNEETELLRSVLVRLDWLPFFTSITGKDFASGAHGRIWGALTSCSPECAGLGEEADDDECKQRGAELAARRDSYLAEVVAALQQGPAPLGDVDLLHELTAAGEKTPATDASVVEAGEAVLASGQERNRLSGTGLVLPTSLPDSADPDRPPLQRVYVAPATSRLVLTSVLTAAGAAVTPGLVTTAGFSGVAVWVACASLVSLLLLSVVISLVDRDTFFVDTYSFYLPLGVSWLLAVAAAGLQGDWSRLLSGLLIVVFTALVFKFAVWAFYKVRKTEGMGFGDTIIIVATAGVPAALSGSFALGYYTVMAGLVVGVLGWTVGALRGRVGRMTPFAFGPYLAAGWVIGWVGVATGLLGSLGI